jgi:hypothetical protein
VRDSAFSFLIFARSARTVSCVKKLVQLLENKLAKDAIVSDEMAKKFETERDTPYTRWVKDEGLDIIGAHYVADLRTVDLKNWARRGGKGVFINHEASRSARYSKR